MQCSSIVECQCSYCAVPWCLKCLSNKESMFKEPTASYRNKIGEIDFYGSRKHFFSPLQARFSFNYGFKKFKKTCTFYIPKLGTSSPNMVLCVADLSALPHGISSSVWGGSLCACALVRLSGYKCGSYIETKWLELFQCWGCSLSLWYVCVSFHRAARRALVKDVFFF